jgi:allantoin racemase
LTDAGPARPTGHRIIVLNPNTNADATRAMLAIARAAAPGIAMEGATGAFGAPFITNAEEAQVGAEAVHAFCDDVDAEAADGLIIAAFADPGLKEARNLLAIPVVGIAEAAMLKAAEVGRFSIIVTTPNLIDLMVALAADYGCRNKLASIRATEGDPVDTMRDETRLVAALEQASLQAIREDRAQAIIIGGGPLAVAARRMAGRLPAPVIEPVPCAVQRILAILDAPAR